MKYITKSCSPESLEVYKTKKDACYKNIPQDVKEDVRKSLVAEQGGICCYCGKRIFPDHHSVIEHLLPKGLKQYSHLQLEYTNLLCSCDGGETDRKGKTKTEKRKFPSFCDDKKNNKLLKVTPLDPTCEEQFSYDEEGNIYGETDDAKDAIKILGLDCAPLNNARKAAIEPYLGLELDNEGWCDEIEDLSQKHDGNYRSFCFAVIYYIRNFKMIV